MSYWLLKSEPNDYSFQDMEKDNVAPWDGVRNYQARNNLKAMAPGDLALFYHSVNEKSVVGIAECVSEHYPDPTTDDDRWVVVDFVPKEKLKRPVTLDEIKGKDELSEMVLVKNTRLSVQPVKPEEFDLIVAISQS